jgi:hypothetical protein
MGSEWSVWLFKFIGRRNEGETFGKKSIIWVK